MRRRCGLECAGNEGSHERQGHRTADTEASLGSNDPGEKDLPDVSSQTLEFYIDAFTPGTMPMVRLGEYLTQISHLYGEVTSVHFQRLTAGSVAILSNVEVEAHPKVRARIERLRLHPTAEDTRSLTAFERIDSMLAQDNAVGLVRENSAVLLRFPGRENLQEHSIPPLKQDAELTGIVFRLGGFRAKVPVHLFWHGQTYQCTADRDTARELAKFLFGSPVRITGTGTWMRTKSGQWMVKAFSIRRFLPLETKPLNEAVKELRQAHAGSGWARLERPASTLADLRGDD